MKKLFVILLLLITCGCGMNFNEPTKQVELFLNKYQSMDSTVLNELNNIINKDNSMSKEDKKEYIGLMEKQYQNLSYKIKDEDIKREKASVLVEIEVYDYIDSINKSKKYYNSHKDEFDLDNTFNSYKIKNLKNVTDKIKYDIKFILEKDNNEEWFIHELSDSDIKKIHGLYSE